MKKIKKYIGEILTIVGSGMIIFNILNFGNEFAIGRLRRPSNPAFRELQVYYPTDVRVWITVGVMMLVLGLLIIKNNFFIQKS